MQFISKSYQFLCLAVLLSSQVAWSQVAAPAALQPGDLTPGDTFFVVFVTGGTQDLCANTDTATAPEIADTTVASINAFGANAATAGSLTSGVASWQSLYVHSDGTTTTNTVQASGAFNNVTNRPIYNVLRQRVANDRTDLFDGSVLGGGTDLINAIAFDENGLAVSTTDLTYTGFDGFGLPIPTRELGARSALFDCAVGEHEQPSNRWVESGFSSLSRHIYVLSPLLQIPAAPSVPASLGEWD